MSNIAKKGIAQALIEDVLTDIFFKTSADMVMLDDTTTVAAKLSEMITSLNAKATKDEVNTEISTAISELIDGAPESYDTLKELADYIANNDTVVDALNAAIGNKVDKVSGKGLSANDFTNAYKAIIDGLGTLASKNNVSQSDLDDSLKSVLNSASTSSHSHSNKTVLDGITSSLITEWNSKGTVFASTTQPTNLAAGDLWVKIIG